MLWEMSDTIYRMLFKIYTAALTSRGQPNDSVSICRVSILLAIAIFSIMSFAGSACGQQIVWSKSLGGTYNEGGYSCVQTSDGGYVVVGSTFSYGFGDFDIYLVRFNSEGDTVFTRTFGGPAAEYGYEIQSTADGGFVIVGSSMSYGFGMGDVYLIKTDASGGMLWSHTYGGGEEDLGRSVRETPDHGFVICGTTKSFGLGYGDVYLVKTDSLGTAEWAKAYGGAAGEAGWAVRLCPDGGFIISGATGSYGGGYSSVYAIRTESDGDTLWTRVYGGDNSDFGYSVQPTMDGGFIFAGATASSGAGYSDAYLVKTDSIGTVDWEKTYGGTKDDRAYSVYPTADGGYVLAGITESSGAGKIDMYVVKTDPLGDVMWSRTYGGTRSDFARVVIEEQHLNFILVGCTYSFTSGGSDLYVMKIGTPMATAVDDDRFATLPDGYELAQNYPNPFNAATRIEFSLPTRTSARLTIYNLLGREVREWFMESLPAGQYSVEWDGADGLGRTAASGVYLYSLRAGEYHDCRKMVLLK